MKNDAVLALISLRFLEKSESPAPMKFVFGLDANPRFRMLPLVAARSLRRIYPDADIGVVYGGREEALLDVLLGEDLGNYDRPLINCFFQKTHHPFRPGVQPPAVSRRRRGPGQDHSFPGAEALA